MKKRHKYLLLYCAEDFKTENANLKGKIKDLQADKKILQSDKKALQI